MVAVMFSGNAQGASQAINQVGDTLKQLPTLVLGAFTIAVPFALFVFKRRSLLMYGLSEVCFSIILGFAAAIKLAASSETGAAWVAFLSAMYVGARGWSNVYDGWNKGHH